MRFNRDVDIVVGAQYGDEGKGMIANLLADRAAMQERPYKWTARVGGQNAEHRFIHDACEFCARILPSASAFRKDIVAVLGAGHCFNPHQLILEAVHLGVSPDRIVVDPQAMWLKPEHAASSTGEVRGTTGWGVGRALAEKVLRGLDTQLVGKCEELQSYLNPYEGLRNVSEYLDEITDGPGLIEGSQGALLSMDHGPYPWVTGKNVTVPAILGELGINPKRLRTVYGVVRAIPLRVPGTSGPTMGKEISYAEVEQRTGLRMPQHKRLQGDTMLRPIQEAEERLFEFSMDELKTSHRLNGFDRIALTFVDYLSPGDYRVGDYELLHEGTKNLISSITSTLGVPVFLVRTGQGEHDNIWMDGEDGP